MGHLLGSDSIFLLAVGNRWLHPHLLGKKVGLRYFAQYEVHLKGRGCLSVGGSVAEFNHESILSVVPPLFIRDCGQAIKHCTLSCQLCHMRQLAVCGLTFPGFEADLLFVRAPFPRVSFLDVQSVDSWYPACNHS